MAEGKLNIPDFARMKREQQKITMLTAYDYPTALMVEEAGIDMILVGDSLGMTVLGLESTVPVTMEDMLHHTRAVTRAARRIFVVADMPFLSYQVNHEEAIRNAGCLIKEGGTDAVKLEGGGPVVETVRAVVEAGIPVMAHLGLTPQTAAQLGGYRVQGKEPEAARRIKADAVALAEAGAFSIVLECVPASLAREITATIGIPTIGIGAGPDCDGQVLVFHDLVGLFEKFMPKFVKQYVNVREPIIKAMQQYAEEVREGVFPDAEHSFK